MTMMASVLWKRLDAPGHDFCQLAQEPYGWTLEGTAVFVHDSAPARVSYAVRCNPNWEAVSGLIRGSLGVRSINHVVTRQGRLWFLNGNRVSGLEHLVDLDFGFTPATNLTQLRRVSLAATQAVQVPVAWFDLSSEALTELPQLYEGRGENLVWYEAPTVGYRGLLELDAHGFVSRYPGLWQAETSRHSQDRETE